MKFDGAKYLETNIRETFDIKNGISAYCEIFSDNDQSYVDYGDLKLETEGDKKFFRFSPTCFRDIKFDGRVEIGNRTKYCGKCTAAFETYFKHNDSNYIKCVVDLGSASENVYANGVVVLDKVEERYRGIYYIDMHHYECSKISPMLSYYDGKVLDLLNEKHNEGEVRKIIGLSPDKLENLGFSSDMKKVFTEEEVCGRFGCYSIVLRDTFKKGSLEAFEKWVNKAFKEQRENNKENNGQSLAKRRG